MDTLADHLYETGGIAVIDTEYLEEVVQTYNKKIEEDDGIRYRWLRFGLNLQLANSKPKDHEKYGKLLLEDAKKYIEFESEDPAGYVLEAIAHLTRDDTRYIRDASKALSKAEDLLDQGKRLRLFDEKKIRDLNDKLKHNIYVMSKRNV